MGEIRLSRHEKAHITVWTEGRARLIHAKEGWRFKCALGRGTDDKVDDKSKLEQCVRGLLFTVRYKQSTGFYLFKRVGSVEHHQVSLINVCFTGST